MTHVKLKPFDLFRLVSASQIDRHHQTACGVSATRLAAYAQAAGLALWLMPPVERKAAEHAPHVLLYIFLFVLPFPGCPGQSSQPPCSISQPCFTESSPGRICPSCRRCTTKNLSSILLALTHTYLAWSLIALLVLHIAAALRHHLILRDDILTRMLPWGRRHAETKSPYPDDRNSNGAHRWRAAMLMAAQPALRHRAHPSGPSIPPKANSVSPARKPASRSAAILDTLTRPSRSTPRISMRRKSR